MKQSRRSFLQILGLAGLASTTSGNAVASEGPPVSPDTRGCLVELSLCVGCRKCEAACNKANQLPAPEQPFEDKSVLDQPRRPSASAFTVVNQHVQEENSKVVYSKAQCMHCLDPACVSACIVGALVKDPDGPVTYDAGKCIGCRYCMVACPFQIPAYEYEEVLTPRVRKCEFCTSRLETGELPACAAICPEEAITFGKREELLKIARDRINLPQEHHRHRQPPINHIYGEKEVGGTSWMYLSPVPFENLGFLKLPDKAPPRTTETIQHGIFKYFIPPAMLFGLLGAAMHLLGKRREDEGSGKVEVEE